MIKLTLIFVPLLVPINSFLFFRSGSFNCSRNGIICSSETTFTFCYRIGDYVVKLNEAIGCASGFVCSEDSNFPCVPSVQTESTSGTTTQKLITSTSTTPEISTVPSSTTTNSEATTTTAAKTSTTTISTTASTTDITSTITTSSTTQSPITSTPEVTISASTTTTNTSAQQITLTVPPSTIQPIVEPPDCKGTSGFYPSSKCNQYYECSPAFLWWWYEPHLKTCPDGEAYNGRNGCEPSSTCNI